MKKIVLSIMSVGVLYISAILLYPHVIAQVNDSEYVTGTDLLKSIPQRWMSTVGGKMMYLEGSNPSGIKVTIIDKHGKSDNILFDVTEGRSYSLVTDEKNKRFVMVSWVDSWRGGEVRFEVCVVNENNKCDKSFVDTEINEDTYSVVDYEDGKLYGRSLLKDSGGKIRGTLFLLNAQGGNVLEIPQKVKEVRSISVPGAFWKDGLIYQVNDDVVFINYSGEQYLLATINNAAEMEFYSNQNSVLWFSHWWPHNSDKDHGIFSYRGNEVFRFVGACPRMTEDGIVYVRRGKGIFYLTNTNEEILIKESIHAWCPAYLENKIYWTEKRYNYAYPLHLISYLFGVAEQIPDTYQSYIFSMELNQEVRAKIH